MTLIFDYNLGNPKSIKNMLAYLGIESRISANHADIALADRLILPGVGHFHYGMEQLEKLGLIDVLKTEVINNKKPILGICLGMQLLTKHSEEGNLSGLAFIDAQTKKFEFNDLDLKVPHMGWNSVEFKKKSQINSVVSDNSRYYFVHSYFVDCTHQEDILCTTFYGRDFVSGFQHQNIFGLQFHPEKSHKFGMELLANFCKI
jgi:glutamine amidotransferase